MVNQVGAGESAVSPRTLRSGQLAALAGVNIETLRFYEREGLLERPYQHPSGYRAYPADEVETVQTIKRAQALGFKLAEIRELLKGARTGKVSELATRKLQEVDASIARLVIAREELTRLIDFRCDRLLGCSCGQADCPVHLAADTTVAVDQAVLGRRTGLLTGGAAAAACAICCAPLVGGLLAALGIPALTVSGAAQVGVAGAAVAATAVGVARVRKRRARQP